MCGSHHGNSALITSRAGRAVFTAREYTSTSVAAVGNRIRVPVRSWSWRSRSIKSVASLPSDSPVMMVMPRSR